MKWKNGSTRLFTALALVAVFGCGNERPDAVIGDRAPDTFTVGFETSAGPFAIEFVRDWSPIAVDRAYRLSSMGYWAGSRIYRVNEAYAQFGYSGRPALDSAWVPDGLPDEPARSSNVRGSVSFARGGPNTRSTILFINRGDNVNLDDMQWNDVVGFPPSGPRHGRHGCRRPPVLGLRRHAHAVGGLHRGSRKCVPRAGISGAGFHHRD